MDRMVCCSIRLLSRKLRINCCMAGAGMNKLIINHLDKIFVTNDAATIVKEMDVEHPCAKMIVMAAASQEKEV
jgi:chaperonin GroEL (HSP60 family)